MWPSCWSRLELLGLSLLVGLWGVRLAIYIGNRNHGQPEDYRYAAWREENGARWWWFSYFKVFLLQGSILWIVSLPLYFAQAAPSPYGFTAWDMAGLLLFVVGFYFEVVGDWQLQRFKADSANKGKLFTSGLWAYTRHPNYFGEAVLWWGFYLIALGVGGYLSVIGPLLMTFLLLKVSGVAMLERTMKKSKPGYEEYVQRTNAFFPWFPSR